MDIKSDVTVDKAKELASNTLDNYSEAELSFYDFSFFLKWKGEEEDKVTEYVQLWIVAGGDTVCSILLYNEYRSNQCAMVLWALCSGGSGDLCGNDAGESKCKIRKSG